MLEFLKPLFFVTLSGVLKDLYLWGLKSSIRRNRTTSSIKYPFPASPVISAYILIAISGSADLVVSLRSRLVFLAVSSGKKKDYTRIPNIFLVLRRVSDASKETDQSFNFNLRNFNVYKGQPVLEAA